MLDRVGQVTLAGRIIEKAGLDDPDDAGDRRGVILLDHHAEPAGERVLADRKPVRGSGRVGGPPIASACTGTHGDRSCDRAGTSPGAERLPRYHAYQRRWAR